MIPARCHGEAGAIVRPDINVFDRVGVKLGAGISPSRNGVVKSVVSRFRTDADDPI